MKRHVELNASIADLLLLDQLCSGAWASSLFVRKAIRVCVLLCRCCYSTV